MEGSRRSLRVLHVVRPAAGGMKEHVFELCEGLRASGHRVEIACPEGSPVAEEARQRGLVVHPITLVGPLSPLADLRGIRDVRRLVRAGDFDLVHAHGFKAGLVARMGASRGDCRSRVLTVHGHVMYREDISRFTKWTYRVVERGLSRRTTRIIAVSDAIKNELVDAYGIEPDRIVTVRNGVDVDTFASVSRSESASIAFGAPSGALVVGTAARFASAKGLRHFVHAAAQLSARRSDVFFLLGGDGPLKGDLEQAVDDAGIGDRLKMVGFVRDMPTFFSALDVYVSSSLSEGLPLTLAQAGAAGLPVVATDVGGTAEVVRDGESGLLVAPAEPGALADAIECLLADAEMRERFGAAGRRIARAEFSPRRMVEETELVYAQAVALTQPAKSAV